MRFDDYSIGDTLHESALSSGVVVAMATHPERPTHGYVVVRHGNGHFTVYGCLRDAACKPFLPRHIPGGVLRDLIKQAFDVSLTMPLTAAFTPVVEDEKSPVLDESWVPEGMSLEEFISLGQVVGVQKEEPPVASVQPEVHEVPDAMVESPPVVACYCSIDFP